MSHRAPRAWAPCLLIAFTALAPAGCGGDDGEGKRFADEPAASPKPFVKQFHQITGVRLRPVTGDLFGTRLEVPAKPNRFVRFGAYSLIWTKDEKKRKLYLGEDEADDDGIYWKKTGTSWSAAKAYGDNLVLRWVGRPAKETNAQWDRLERAVKASLEGTLDPLPAEERPCRNRGLDPLRGRTGECSVNGLPVSFVEADQDLSTPALEARVLGFGYAEDLRNPGVAPLRPRGRFLIVAYRVTNRSDQPISFIHPDLRLGARMVPESPDASAMMPRSRALPLPPGATVEARAGFDVDAAIDPRSAAFMLPAERDGKNDPSPLIAQGWIRLAKVKPRLPRAPGVPRGQPDPAGKTSAS